MPIHGAQVRVFTGGYVDDRFTEKYSVTKREGVYLLTLINASLSDVGTYTCIDKLGLGESAAAELVLLSKYILLMLAINYFN